MIRYAYSGESAVDPADKDAYRAWATGRGMQTMLILLLMSILLTLGLTSLWKKRADGG